MPEDEFSAEIPQLSKETDRAAKAKAVMKNPLIREAFDGLRETYVRQLRDAPIRDVEGIQLLKIMLSTVDTVEGHLERAIKTGKLADQRLTIIERMREAKDSSFAWFDQQLSAGDKV